MTSSEHLEYLPGRGHNGVSYAKADRYRTLFQTSLDSPLHFFHFGICREPMRRVSARQECPWILEHGHPYLNVTDADSVVDQPAGLSLPIPFINIRCSYFECRGHSIEGLISVRFIRLTVRVQVNESRRDHQAGCIDSARSPQRARVHHRNFAVPNSHIAYRVQARLGVDHTAPEITRSNCCAAAGTLPISRKSEQTINERFTSISAAKSLLRISVPRIRFSQLPLEMAVEMA